jgi:hypothetical protein
MVYSWIPEVLLSFFHYRFHLMGVAVYGLPLTLAVTYSVFGRYPAPGQSSVFIRFLRYGRGLVLGSHEKATVQVFAATLQFSSTSI